MKTVLLSVCISVFAGAAWAQSVAGAGVVSGVVEEVSESGIPGAEVVLENPAIGFRRILDTSLDGLFEASAVPPAAGYHLHVTYQKFQPWESGTFEISAGQKLSFAVTLRPQEAAISTQVLPHTTDVVSALVDSGAVTGLPAAQRHWDTLATLAPTTAADRSLGAITFRGDTSATAYYIDGLLASGSFSTRSTGPAVPPAQDALQGFQVLASGAPAEFGHSMSGTVNVVTRSGGNDLHGSAYGFFSNDSLTAKNRYSLGNDLFRSGRQLGFQLGGKIPGSKLFFFTNLENSQQRGQGLNRLTSPLLADSNCTATTAQCAKAIGFLDGQKDVLVPQSEQGTTGMARLDYRYSEHHTFTLAGYAAHERSPRGMLVGTVAPNGGLLGDSVTRQDSHSGKLEWTSVPSPNSTNELRLGLFQDRVANTASESGLSTGRLGLSIAGATVGESDADANLRREWRTQLVDNFRFTASTHTILAGLDWTRTGNWLYGLENEYGSYAYPTFTAFAKDFSGDGGKNYSLFSQTYGIASRNMRGSKLGAYAQDTWKASPALWVTVGIRWSKPFLPQPTMVDSTYYRTHYIDSPNNNVDPRVGVSYALGHHMVARGSFGYFHTAPSGELLDALFRGNGIYQSTLEAGPLLGKAPVFPALVDTSKVPPGSLDLMYLTSKARAPYSRQWTLTLERSLGAGTTLSASFLDNSGRKLWTADDVNLAGTSTAIYTINGEAADTYSMTVWRGRNDTKYAHIYEVTNGGNSWFRALAVQVRKSMSHGFSAQGAYTWSHAIDDVGGRLVAGSIPFASYSSDHRVDLGSSATDQRHRATISWSWQPRVGGGPARYIVNGWELSSITTLASPLPATALVLVNGQQFTAMKMAYLTTLNGAGSWARVPFLPVSGLRMDPEYTVNARLGRSIPFTERITGRLMFEAFNLANMQFNTGVQSIAYVATGGVLTPLSSLGEGNEARGYRTGSNARSCQVAFRVTF